MSLLTIKAPREDGIIEILDDDGTKVGEEKTDKEAMWFTLGFQGSSVTPHADESDKLAIEAYERGKKHPRSRKNSHWVGR